MPLLPLKTKFCNKENQLILDTTHWSTSLRSIPLRAPWMMQHVNVIIFLTPIQNLSTVLHYLWDTFLFPYYGIQNTLGSGLAYLSIFTFCHLPFELYSTNTEPSVVPRMYHITPMSLCLCMCCSLYLVYYSPTTPTPRFIIFHPLLCSFLFICLIPHTHMHMHTNSIPSGNTCLLLLWDVPSLLPPCVFGRGWQVLTWLHTSDHSWLVYLWATEPRGTS